eukprot:scaffold7381_cov310-Pinguiococcus_pyrenoidosus.AAC.30
MAPRCRTNSMELALTVSMRSETQSGLFSTTRSCSSACLITWRKARADVGMGRSKEEPRWPSAPHCLESGVAGAGFPETP